MRFLPFFATRSHYFFLSLLWLFVLLPATSFAQQEFAGQWYEVSPDWRLTEQPDKTIDAPHLTGGHFVFQSVLDITDADQRIVIDFKNASVLGQFHHTISDASGNTSTMTFQINSFAGTAGSVVTEFVIGSNELMGLDLAEVQEIIIEDDVEIGPNNCIDRATMGSTIIKQGVKTDNLVHIAHNVVVGENTVLAGQTGISGSSKVGKNCMTGGQVGITGHITVGDNVKIAGQSGVSKSIKNDQILQGSPAFSYNDYMRSYAVFKNLPSVFSRIKELENLMK